MRSTLMRYTVYYHINVKTLYSINPEACNQVIQYIVDEPSESITPSNLTHPALKVCMRVRAILYNTK